MNDINGRRLKYSCSCGFLQYSDPKAISIFGEVCPKCNTRVIARSSKIYSPKYSPIVNALPEELDIAAKYKKELNKIAVHIAKYKTVMDGKMKDMINERDKKLNGAKLKLSVITAQREKCSRLYHLECERAIKSSDMSKAQALAWKVRDLEQQEKEAYGNVNRISTEYSSRLEEEINSLNEAKIVKQLFKMRDGYIERIKEDAAKYNDYISAVYQIAFKNNLNWYNQFMDLADSITYEEDDYLMNICSGYKGKLWYIKKANRLKAEYDNRKALDELSRAREIIGGYGDRSIDLDVYSIHASRSCFENYIRNVVAALDESINGFKI